jgi:signal transduction histidine kinase
MICGIALRFFDRLELGQMIHPENLELTANWTKGIEHLVPKITLSILDGVRACNMSPGTETNLFRHPHGISHTKIPYDFKVPLPHSSNVKSSNCKDAHTVFVVHHDPEDQRAVRSFIGGLSHCYNNLLMGIWGYASLIGMTLEKAHPIQHHLGRMEALIQDGSKMINLLFEYIVERRVAAKKLRFRQLIQEIKSYNCIKGNHISLSVIETSIVSLSTIRDKVKIAMCITPVIGQLLTLVQQKRSLMEPHRHGSRGTEIHFEKMDRLLTHGFEMIQNLDFYTGRLQPRKKNVSVKSIMTNYLEDIFVQHRNVAITHDLFSSLSRIDVDPEQIAHAFKQLVYNAAEAVTENGDVHLHVNTLISKHPGKRLYARTSNNYVVITVSDNGRGMATQTHAKIFDPFFIGCKKSGKTGLGLAAAAGIVKSHGGYIQVRSEPGPGMGSIFDVYLPM